MVDISAASNGDIALERRHARCGRWRRAGGGLQRTSATDAAAPGSTPWSYTVNDADLDFLAAGETITFSYTVTATDNDGATATDTVSFTITGTNDAPTVSATAASAFTEALDASAQDLSDSGTVSFDDIDANDVVDISRRRTATSRGAAARSMRALAARWWRASAPTVTDAAAPGSTPWSYSANDADLDFLAAGETHHLHLHGDGDRQQRRDRHRHGELHHHRHQRCADGERDGGLGVHRGAGCERAGPERQRHGELRRHRRHRRGGHQRDASTATSRGAAARSMRRWRRCWWRLQRPSADRRGGAGQHAVELHGQRRRPGLPGRRLRRITFSYTVTATDNSGATATDTVSITITGTNDAPTVSATAASAFTEALDASAQDLSDSGTVSFDDIDATDVVDISAASNGDIAWSGGTIDAGAGGAAGGGLQRPARPMRRRRAARRGATRSTTPTWTSWTRVRRITFTYTVTATDNSGATATDTVSFTITGTNDAPTVSATAASGVHRGAGCERAGPERQRHGQLRRHRRHRRGGHQLCVERRHRVERRHDRCGRWRRSWWRASAADATDAAAPGSTPWSYSVNDADLDFLADGETITLHLHGDGDRQQRRDRDRHGELSPSPAPTMRRR